MLWDYRSLMTVIHCISGKRGGNKNRKGFIPFKDIWICLQCVKREKMKVF